MEILSHRGYWKRPAEKNSTAAFRRSFELGYGTETDLRDVNSQLVISHDMPDSNAIAVDVLFSLYNRSKFHCRPTLALNVKADGLQKLVSEKLNHYHIQNYFLFDMSIPDLIAYKEEGLKFFVRFSEYEPESPLLEDAAGVWLDGFKETILDESLISSLLIRNKKVCLVSPELHAREHFPVWQRIKRLPDSILSSNNFLLCTDLPEDATRFFYGN
ncbi:hypothetical protein D8L93_10905 [Sodalis-like symbiont of Bactericera trigonica]|nr:hypothetical protein D8L93_10905 [Sodalis-like symbiont of Bactericera trigonica]